MPVNTPLHIAIQNGNIEIIKALLADGCETIHVRNADGQTPLDLATAMNNEEIVHLLLEHGAGHPPPMPPPSDFAPAVLNTEQRKKRITFWLVLVCATLGVPVFTEVIRILITAAVFSAPHPPNLHVVANVVYLIYVFIFLIPLYIAYLFCYFLWLFRLWEEVPRQYARSTPEMVAGLSLVPFFNWYWMFVALGGLYQDMNKVLEACGHGKRFNTTLIFVSCFIWLAYNLLTLLCIIVLSVAMAVAPSKPDMSSDFGIIIWGLCCIFTIVIYWIISKNVREFMDSIVETER
jgi:hypothetical protein